MFSTDYNVASLIAEIAEKDGDISYLTSVLIRN
jgi:predicted DNA-binding ribbon-helix-helix protein